MALAFAVTPGEDDEQGVGVQVIAAGHSRMYQLQLRRIAGKTAAPSLTASQIIR